MAITSEAPRVYLMLIPPAQRRCDDLQEIAIYGSEAMNYRLASLLIGPEPEDVPMLSLEAGRFSPLIPGDPRISGFLVTLEWAFSVLNGQSGELKALVATLEAHALANGGQPFSMELNCA